jgi:trimeric autotransporter adhesin
MWDASRPARRLFLLLATMLPAMAAAQTPPLTVVSDVVYRADGTPAQGTLLISWPEFTTAGGQAVAAGNTNTTLGTGGALSVALVSNANATPVSTLYTVVYQLDDGTVKTEYWIVPTTSPATLAQVRTTLGATASVSQMATQQFVNNALAAKANDSAVVHLSGNETITGAKQFTVSPALPAPVQPTDAASKQYVDNSVQNVGSGQYVSIAGATMTGPLTLSGERNDVRRGVYDRIVSGVIAFVVSAVIAMHDKILK